MNVQVRRQNPTYPPDVTMSLVGKEMYVCIGGDVSESPTCMQWHGAMGDLRDFVLGSARVRSPLSCHRVVYFGSPALTCTIPVVNEARGTPETYCSRTCSKSVCID